MATDDKTRTELEAAVYRRLVEHLRKRTDVQNIDLMNLAGFCRNCLSNWMKDAADAKGVAMSKDESREIVYGMPYDEWQREASERSHARAEGRVRKSKPQALNALRPPTDRCAVLWMSAARALTAPRVTRQLPRTMSVRRCWRSRRRLVRSRARTAWE